MSRARSQLERGPGDGAGDGAGANQTLREAELPVRDRRGGTRVDGAQLHGGRQDEVFDVAAGGGGTGADGDGAFPCRQGSPRGAGQQRPGAAGGPVEVPGYGCLSAGLEEPGLGSWTGDFGASLAQFAKIGRFLTGEAAVALGHFELERYLKTEG